MPFARTPRTKGLLFAGTELGIYVSFDDGDHWQPLQLNLPVTSVRDINIHGDDLIVATHGRAFWILDDITPLRQMSAPDARTTLSAGDSSPYRQRRLPGLTAAAGRARAKNPPDGAMIDYYLPSSAKKVVLDILDSNGKLVRRFSSDRQKEPKHPPMAIAERWIPKPIPLQATAGSHRFLWDLRWGSSGASDAEEDSGFGAPRGPRVVPGTYQLKLTVDGNTLTPIAEGDHGPARPGYVSGAERSAARRTGDLQRGARRAAKH